ncbi:hypothetical protein MJ046_03640 [Acinetobacter bereziniae]|uniref:hypothetical protein n=1 Tax=Acinetobacter bereziniae TaxID=106648 RepID=UPI0022EA6F93|nr:hypothetical protein [Acinetobacter bereziniae]MDA3439431.1 hypothetical protein [Acinetobacter bereziniae]
MRFLLSVLVLVLCVVCVFIPGLHGDFILDDEINILFNRLLYIKELNFEDLIYAALSFHDGNGSRALPMASFALDYWCTGSMDASTFKATNIMIHAITTFVLALFFRRLLLIAKWNEKQAAWGALVLTLLWAVHPLQVSSVLYIVQRMQTMATLFIVFALWSYLLMRQNQIDGGRGRLQGILVIIFWLLALACKEDAVLLPVYTLMLELTVLRFQAAQSIVTKGLKQSYTLFSALATFLYLFVIVPYYWFWENYPGRDFNSLERLLTQARILVMYIGQTIIPLSDRLPFIYDDYEISRGLWQPWTTFVALLIILTLLVWAIRWRHKRPLFALGIFLYFSGHFVSSNVIGLELVFEHRNHFPLIGLVLAISDLILYLCQREKINNRITTFIFITLIMWFAGNTLFQSYIWGDGVRLGQKMTKLAPTSVRAWNQYASIYFRRYNKTKDAKELIQAINVTENATKHINSPSLMGNIIIYKSILGTTSQTDWQRYYLTLRTTPNGWAKKESIFLLLENAEKGFKIDQGGLVKSLEIYKDQSDLAPREYFRAGVYIYTTKYPEKALPFFKKVVELYPKNDPEVLRLIGDLTIAGRMNWVDELQQIRQQKS